MIKELDRVILTQDLADHGLKSGDIGTVVLVHKAGKGYEVEFTALDGETLAVTTVMASQVRLAGRREMPHARSLEQPQTSTGL